MRDQLKEFILDFPASEVSITDVTESFWHDTAELRELTKTLKDWKERKRIKATLRSRVERARLAFNQLFLEGKVKNHQGLTFGEMKEKAISRCERSIEETRRMVERGEGGIMTKCWLANLEDYLESYKHTEILKRAEMGSLLRGAYRPKGRLICVGSSLVMEVYPGTICV